MAYVSVELRAQLEEDAGNLCGYCRSDQRNTGFRLQVEHLVPESKEGPTVRENLWLACSSCNGRKSDRQFVTEPESGETVELYNPRTQLWTSHFEWDDSGCYVIGKTDIGRATVDALKMNDLLIVEARKI